MKPGASTDAAKQLFSDEDPVVRGP